MKTNDPVDNIDKLIKDSLNEEESKYYDELDEQGLIDQMTGLYKGKLKIVNYLVIIVQIGLGVGAFYFLNQFLDSESTKEMISSISLTAFCIVSISMLKLYSWMQMDKNAILRELKRLELQIATISKK